MKVFSPVIDCVTPDQGFHSPEVSTGISETVTGSVCKVSALPRRKGQLVRRCRGPSPWRVDGLSVLELGRTLVFLNGALKAEEARGYLTQVVGSIHSRGVHGVMPMETIASLEGIDNTTQGEEDV